MSLLTESKIYVAKHLKHPKLSLRMALTSILENKVDVYVQSLYMHDAHIKLWRDHVTNKELYGRIPRITDTIRHISVATRPSFHVSLSFNSKNISIGIVSIQKIQVSVSYQYHK